MTEMDRFKAIRETACTRWLELHFDYPHEEFCLIWPFARKGGGYADVGKDAVLVHRLMCEVKNGPAPSPEHHAAHSCGRGKDGCVNLHHLRWKTPAENQLERHQHEVRTPRARITPEQAAQIRALKGLQTADQTAEIYGISESNVRLIQAGKTWKADNRCRIFSRDEVMQIRAKPWQRSLTEWAAHFGVHVAVIDRIRTGRSYKEFPAGDQSLTDVPNSSGNRKSEA